MSIVVLCIIAIIVIASVKHAINEKKYKKLQGEVLRKLGFQNWQVAPHINEHITVNSRQALDKYDDVKFFKENKDKLAQAENVIITEEEIASNLRKFLEDNEYKDNPQYSRLETQIGEVLKDLGKYRIKVEYISRANNYLGDREIEVGRCEINRFKKNPALLMGKAEYNKFLKEQQKRELDEKQNKYYGYVNKLVDYANKNRDTLVIRGNQEQLDNLIANLFDRTVNSIKKIKTIDSEEWNVIGNFIKNTKVKIEKIVGENRRILNYYKSPDFLRIKETCEVLMGTQREFNEYIAEKAESVSKLFGTRVVRNQTVNDDEYSYIRTYKKTITPFTAEVSATVFASAENSPLEYVVKYFYPNKEQYPEQIQKLHLLIEELETLKEAKQIIENYKKEYQQYLGDVPDYVMQGDEAGFYSRLGFANIDESVLEVAYKFSYTSGGGMAQRSFTVPMTEENIVALIKLLESKLTANTFAKEQRTLMTKKLREFIKQRDNFTCRYCGNSTNKEPNLLLEIDHIIPVSKGGCTVEDNLQTLCWKCNRAKSNKIIVQ